MGTLNDEQKARAEVDEKRIRYETERDCCWVNIGIGEKNRCI